MFRSGLLYLDGWTPRALTLSQSQQAFPVRPGSSCFPHQWIFGLAASPLLLPTVASGGHCSLADSHRGSSGANGACRVAKWNSRYRIGKSFCSTRTIRRFALRRLGLPGRLKLAGWLAGWLALRLSAVVPVQAVFSYRCTSMAACRYSTYQQVWSGFTTEECR